MEIDCLNPLGHIPYLGGQSYQQKLLENRSNLPLPKSLGETRSFGESDYRYPLEAVRPETITALKIMTPAEIPPQPPVPHTDEARHRAKFAKEMINPGLGYGGGTTFSFPRFGYEDKPLTNSKLADFVSDYKFRRSTEWPTITDSGVGSSMPNYMGYDIYEKTIGLIPYYAGHIPGYIFRCGETFGNDTVNAKSWLKAASLAGR